MLGKYVFVAMLCANVVFAVMGSNVTAALGWFVVLLLFFLPTHPTWSNYKGYFG